ncbi:unnamed protein product [Closterium sp. NIES-64]|nr:unnamed protein product [Closterium sp. NIES-64]
MFELMTVTRGKAALLVWCLAVGPDAAEVAAGSRDVALNADAGIEGWNTVPGVYNFAYAHESTGASAEAASAENTGTAERVVVQCLSVADGELLMVDATAVARAGSAAAGGVSPSVSHLEIRVSEHTSADTPPTSTNYGKNFTNLPALVTSISSAIIEQLPSSTTSGTPAGTAGAGAAAAGAAAAGAGAADAAQPTSTGTAGQESTRGSGREGERAGGVYFDEPQRGSVGGMGGGEGIVYPPIPAGPLYDDLHPGGGAGIMPSRGMPSGARFDPFGPPGIPGFEPGRFGDGRPRPRGPPGGGVHPDMQHFPGSDDFL